MKQPHQEPARADADERGTKRKVARRTGRVMLACVLLLAASVATTNQADAGDSPEGHVPHDIDESAGPPVDYVSEVQYVSTLSSHCIAMFEADPDAVIHPDPIDGIQYWQADYPDQSDPRRPVSMVGTPGDDVIFGSAASDLIWSDEGNDLICGGPGNDGLSAPSGTNRIFGNDGDDSLVGGDDDDYLIGGHGEDRLQGRDGADQMCGQTGFDTYFGAGRTTTDAYIDTLWDIGPSDITDVEDTYEAHCSHVVLGVENPRVLDEHPTEIVPGGPTAADVATQLDKLLYIRSLGERCYEAYAAAIQDGGVVLVTVDPNTNEHVETWLPATADDDSGDYYEGSGILSTGNDRAVIFLGSPGPDTYRGQGGNDVLCGGDGNDDLRGRAGDDVIIGGGGNDDLRGDTGDDHLWGNAGDDELRGGEGADHLMGGDDLDLLIGHERADHLWGGAGNDELRGKSGDDYLCGGDGSDVVKGGTGKDVEEATICSDVPPR